MMTIVTQSKLRQGAEPEWDDAMRQRLATAQGRPGFVRSQLLIPIDQPNGRVIIGTWRNRADWEAWHTDETFRETRERLDGLQEAPSQTAWYEVIADERPVGPRQFAEEAFGRARATTKRVSARLQERRQPR